MTDSESLQIAAFAGSLREASFNRSLLRACVEHSPADMDWDLVELGDIPLYDGDVEEDGDPPAVVDLKTSIGDADGLLIVTPEYNHGIPAVTKNAVDWASRPPERILSQKPVAITGASPSMTGTARAQSALRQALASVDALTMQDPGMLVAHAHEKFEDGRLVDDSTEDFIGEFLSAFGDWIRRLQA